MAESPASASANDEFDALLFPIPSASVGRPHLDSPGHERQEGAAPGVAVQSQPTTRLADFVDNWSLYRDPVLAGVLAGAALGALGVFVLLRRAVFATAALSQAAGLGVALAFFVQIHLDFPLPPAIGALAMSALLTTLVGVRRFARLSREAVVGFSFVAASALAVLVGDSISQEAHDIAAILFGTAVLVRQQDLAVLAAATVACLVGVVVLRRALTFTGLDPDAARVQGLPVRAIEVTFWGLFAVEVSVATRALGSLPVFAFAVLPAASGLVLAERVDNALIIAVLVGAGAGGVGYAAAFFGELPVGAAQATTAAGLCLGAFVVARWRGR